MINKVEFVICIIHTIFIKIKYNMKYPDIQQISKNCPDGYLDMDISGGYPDILYLFPTFSTNISLTIFPNTKQPL